MKGKWLLLGSALMLAAVLAVWSAPASAYTFGFEDVAYVSSSGGLTTAFPGYVGPPNYSTAGYYQVLSTNPNTTNWSDLNATNPLPVYVFKVGTTPGEFIQNDPLFPTVPPLQGTEGEDILRLSGGWTAPAVNGHVIQHVTTSAAGASFQFYGFNNNQPGNTPVSFTFNGFDLSGTATGVDFQVLDQNNNVLYDSGAFNLSSTPTTYDPEVANAYKVVFIAGTGINVDNVEINDAVPAVPIPPSALLLGTGLLGMVGLGWRSKKASQA